MIASKKSSLAEEGKRILSAAGGSYLVSLCIEGKELSSEELAVRLRDLPVRGISNLAFCIGSSFGLSPEVKNASSLKLSFSPMTFPHQLARVMLCEQVYRAFQIGANGKYHK